MVRSIGDLNKAVDTFIKSKDYKALKNSKKLSPEAIENLLQKTQEDVRLNRCPECKVPYVPAEDCKNFITGKWDEHSYKGNCKHFPKNLRISIG